MHKLYKYLSLSPFLSVCLVLPPLSLSLLPSLTVFMRMRSHGDVIKTKTISVDDKTLRQIPQISRGPDRNYGMPEAHQQHHASTL